MSNDTICFRFEHIRHPRLFSETQSALNCGMVCVRGQAVVARWYKYKGFILPWEGKDVTGPTGLPQHRLFWSLWYVEKWLEEKRDSFHLSTIWVATATCTANLHKPTKILAGFSCAFGSLLQMASIMERSVNTFYKMIKGLDKPICFVQCKHFWRSCRRSIVISNRWMYA